MGRMAGVRKSMKHGSTSIILVNVVALTYGLSATNGVANLLTAYLIECALIGLGASTLILRKIFLTKKYAYGFGLLLLFSLAYFSWLSIFLVLPMELSGDRSLEKIAEISITEEVITLELLLTHVSTLLVMYVSSLILFIFDHHWQVLLALTFVSFISYLSMRSTDSHVQTTPFLRFIMRPFWRLMFLLHGPYFIGFLVFYESGQPQLSWSTSALIITAIAVGSTILQLWQNHDTGLKETAVRSRKHTQRTRPSLRSTLRF
jgi:hypothetical protein